MKHDAPPGDPPYQWGCGTELWTGSLSLFGFFRSPAEKQARERKLICEQLARSREIKKMQFRANMIEHMRSLNSDVIVLVNSQSDIFYAYSPSSRSFYSGRLYDNGLPSTIFLENEILSNRFDAEAEKIKSGLSSPKRVDLDYHDHRNDGFSYFEELCHPEEITVIKNGKLVGRSHYAYPKPNGYLRRVIINSIINDLRGHEDGFSTISIVLCHTFCGGSHCSTLNYNYADTPRRSQDQSIQYLSTVVSLFVDFLDAIEIELLNPVDLVIECGKIGKKDIDDTLLDLPANRHPNPSRRRDDLLQESDLPGPWRT